MCGACYSGFADVAGTSAPFAAAGVAVARQRWKLRFARLAPRRRRTAGDGDDGTLRDHDPLDETVA